MRKQTLTTGCDLVATQTAAYTIQHLMLRFLINLLCQHFYFFLCYNLHNVSIMLEYNLSLMKWRIVCCIKKYIVFFYRILSKPCEINIHYRSSRSYIFSRLHWTLATTSLKFYAWKLRWSKLHQYSSTGGPRKSSAESCSRYIK